MYIVLCIYIGLCINIILKIFKQQHSMHIEMSHQQDSQEEAQREYLTAIELHRIAIANADTDDEFSDSDLSSESDFEFTEPAPVHLCNYCKKPRVFTNEKHYRLHMRAHMKKWRCELCKDEFRTRVSLIHHQIICKKKK